MNRPRAAAIVPAFNESHRVCAVLDALAGAKGVDEINIVTDGCSDDTAHQVRLWLDARIELTPPAHLYELRHNIGKGGAMTHGAHRTDAEILLFLDADLIGLRSDQVDDMLAPMLREEKPADMVLGLFGAVRGGLLGWWLGWCHRLYPFITGQRAIRRDIFLSIPDLTHSRFGVEAAITRWVRSDPDSLVDYVYIHNVTHPIKEEKMGYWKGFRVRMRMYRDIIVYLTRSNLNQAVDRSREEAVRMKERFNNK